MSTNEPRILFLDCETLPDLSQVLKAFPRLSDWPGLTLKAQINSLLCFGYKWLGEPVKVASAWEFKGWRTNVNDDKELLEFACKIIADADVIVTWNGKRFDWKFIQTRLMKHRMRPLPKIKHIDLCQESKKSLFLLSNSLNNVSEFLLDDKKMDNGGWELWNKVHRRDKRAMKKMAKYCAKDVELMPPIFKRMKPFLKLPNYNMYTEPGSKPVCPNCGSTRLKRHGLRVSDQRLYTRYLCNDCLTASRDHNGKDLRHL